jgi:hypothetical protein
MCGRSSSLVEKTLVLTGVDLEATPKLTLLPSHLPSIIMMPPIAMTPVGSSNKSWNLLFSGKGIEFDA